MKITYVKLDTVEYGDVSGSVGLLPEYRRNKTERYRYDSDKLLSLTAGLLILREAGDGDIVIGEHGKPYFKDNSLYYSVSHSGKAAAIAVDEKEVGLDIEKLPDGDFLKIAKRFYHPNELDFVLDSADRARAFARIWTRKEAYLKQTGIGISTDLRGFDTTSGELSGRIASFDIEGCAISVCTTGIIDENEIYISKKEIKELIKNRP